MKYDTEVPKRRWIGWTGVLVLSFAAAVAAAASPAPVPTGSSTDQSGAAAVQPAPIPIGPSIGFRVKVPNDGSSLSPTGIAAAVVLIIFGLILWGRDIQSLAGICIVLGLVVAFLASGQRRYYHYIANNQGYAPSQPIAYSHALHAGTLGISCLYCHYNAEKSRVASIPSISVCMNCHSLVRSVPGDNGPNPEIAKLVKAWNSRNSASPDLIVWNRVHKLPSFVRFSHRIHVANGISCQECHGMIQTMTRVHQAAPLNMGWCINCHRLNKEQAPAHWKKAGGPLDCIVCHH